MLKKLKSFLFENRGARQTVSKNIFWLSVSQIGSRLIRAVIIIYAARVLGAGEYGIFSYVLGFAGFFTVFADIGINSLLTRAVAHSPKHLTQYFATSFWLKSLLILFTTLLVVLVAPKITNLEQAVPLIPFVAFLVIFDNIREFSLAYLRGLEKMEWEAFVVVIMNVAIVVAGFIILTFSQTAKALFLTYIASVGLAAALSIFITREQFSKIFYYFDKRLALQIIRDCWPIAFSSIFGIFMLNIDIVMLGWWRTAEEIGYYSAGQRITQVLYTLPALLASATFPIISRLVRAQEEEKEKSLNERSMTILFMVAIPLVIGGLILSHPIIELVFGKEYLPATSAFQILITTLFLIFPGVLLVNLILAHNQQKKIVYFVIAGSLGNVIFNALLIPPLGIAGAAIATFIAQFSTYGLMWFIAKRVSNFYTLRHLKKITAAAVIMGLIVFILDKIGVNVILNIILSAGIYFGTLYLIKEKILEEGRLLLKNLTG